MTRTTFEKLRAELESAGPKAGSVPCVDNRELFDRGVFEWAGRYPMARWISINTARQYVTARTYGRRAVRERSG
jgi:hypothetical protein